MFTDKPESYRGVYSLLLTPFKEDKSIDYDVYAQYVEWQVERGTHHLFSVCGSSEMTTLTPEERVKCATIAAKHSGSAEVVATANLEPTWHMQVEEVKRMEQTGVTDSFSSQRAMPITTRGLSNISASSRNILLCR